METGWYRGTTPTNIFYVNIDLREAEVFISYYQQGELLVEKTGTDLFVAKNAILVTLTQEDTLKFKTGDVKIQIRYIMDNGKSDASNIMIADSKEILKDGVIAYV